MAGNLNKVFLMGNLTRDIELKHTPSNNTAVANIGIAVNRKYRVGDENREETTFVDCEAWAERLKSCSSTSGRGAPFSSREG